MNINLKKLREDFISGNNYFLTYFSEQYGSFCMSHLCIKFDCSRELAEDIFMDAVLNFREQVVQKKLNRLSNPKSYMLGTCINLYKLTVRNESRKNIKRDDIEQELYLGNPNYLDRTIEQESESEVMNIALESFDKLDKNCQEILRLFYVEGLKMAEIGKVVGLANDKVAKTTKSRCYKKWLELASRLKKKYYAD